MEAANKLVVEQVALAQQIQVMCNDVSTLNTKLPKTQLERMLQELTNLAARFLENHKALLPLQKELQQAKYFKDEYFGKITSMKNVAFVKLSHLLDITLEKNSKQDEKISEDEGPLMGRGSMNDQVMNPVRRSSRIKNKNCLLSLISLLLILPSLKANVNVNITTFKNKAGIFFESQGTVGLTKTSWDIVVGVNLTDYCVYKQKVDAAVASIRRMKEMFAENRFILEMVDELENQVEVSKSNHQFIMTNIKDSSRRQKRAPLAFMGVIQHALFGVMDEAHAKILINEIKKSRSNEAYLLEIARNQSSVHDQTVDVFKMQAKATQDGLRWAKESIEELKNRLNGELKLNQGVKIVMRMNMAMHGLKSLQHSLMSLIWNQKGNFMERLLPIHKFHVEIKFISANLDEELTLPSMNPVELGKVATVFTATCEQMLLFKIKIPLINKNTFTAYHTVSYPTMHDGVFVSIKPASQLIDRRKTVYYSISEHELYHCQKMPDGMICPQKHPIYNIASVPNCEVQLLAKGKKLEADCKINIVPMTNVWLQLNAHVYK